MDYRKFLSKAETLVLPYFGGGRVDAADRRLRVADADASDREPGWWTFTVEGRRVHFGEPAGLSDRPELGRLKAVRGHWAEGYLFSSGREVSRFALPPDEEPEPFAPCVGRRWYGGELLFDCVDFEDDAELGARDALERTASIEDVKGVVPSLRAAYGYAVLCAAARELGIAVAPSEVRGQVAEIAARGRAAADELLAHIASQRHEYRVLHAARNAVPQGGPAVRIPVRRAEEALDAAGARMVRARLLDDVRMEVHFDFLGERFISVVQQGSLHVYDSGICLSGADEELTLESLPSAIREAIETDQLYITRR